MKIINRTLSQEKAADNLNDFEIDALIGIGGDGTFKGLEALSRHGIKVCGIPATIDNDVGSTDETIGFTTALNTICECVDKLKDTSGSHQRCSLIEVMGRDTSVVFGHAKSSGRLRAIVSSDNQISENSATVKFNLNPKKVFVFSKETEERLV